MDFVEFMGQSYMNILIYTQTDKNSLDCFRLSLRNDAVRVARVARLCEGEA
jgi:hypothetical protein